MGSDSSDDIERLLRHAFQFYTDGAQGTAIGILLGLEQGRKGSSPVVLRKAAAERLGYYSVETLRQQPEYNAISYVADVLLRALVDAQRDGVTDGTKVDRLMALIIELSLAEYWERTRRVRKWFAVVAQKQHLINTCIALGLARRTSIPGVCRQQPDDPACIDNENHKCKQRDLTLDDRPLLVNSIAVAIVQIHANTQC